MLRFDWHDWLINLAISAALRAVVRVNDELQKRRRRPTLTAQEVADRWVRNVQASTEAYGKAFARLPNWP